MGELSAVEKTVAIMSLGDEGKAYQSHREQKGFTEHCVYVFGKNKYFKPKIRRLILLNE